MNYVAVKIRVLHVDIKQEAKLIDTKLNVNAGVALLDYMDESREGGVSPCSSSHNASPHKPPPIIEVLQLLWSSDSTPS